MVARGGWGGVTREQLEHLIRAAGAILGDRDVVVIGSQAILGAHPAGLPEAATESMEADLLPVGDADGRKADLIDGAIGEASPFHERFAIYAQGVSRETARLPAGWEERLVEVRGENTYGVTGHCLEPHDLLISKYVAGRPKDMRFCAAIVAAGLVRQDILLERLASTHCTPDEAQRARARIVRDFQAAERRADR